MLPRELATGDALPEKPILITFDDGYRSNYDLVYPILREYGVKACISIIVLMPDLPTDNFCTWNQLREMTASGLVEIGSHSYRLHNLGGDGGNFESGGANGVERRPNESDADFQTRVLDDIQLSHDRIAEELGGVTCFAYPFGCSDPDAKALVDELFPVTLMTMPSVPICQGAPRSAPVHRYHEDRSGKTPALTIHRRPPAFPRRRALCFQQKSFFPRGVFFTADNYCSSLDFLSAKL